MFNEQEGQIAVNDEIFFAPNSENFDHEILWHLELEGSVNRLGAGAGVWIYNLENNHSEGHAYRFNFKCTNNIAEYEALILGLKLVRNLGAKIVSVMGDSELIIKQIDDVYIKKDPRLSCYRGTIVEILNTFLETKLAVIPRKHNMQAHSLAMFSSTFKLPFQPNHQYITEVRHRPAIPDNLKNWKIFSNDKQINKFLLSEEEFVNNNIDTDTSIDPDNKDKIEINEIEGEEIDRFHPTKFKKLDVENLGNVDIDEIINEDTKVINLKDNFLPKGLNPLEDPFDSNDVPRKPKMEPLKSDMEECNIGTDENPKLIKLGVMRTSNPMTPASYNTQSL